jgi:hypothetical protein
MLLQTFPKLNQNVIYSGYCDVLSDDDSSYVNARVTLQNERTVIENGGRTVVIWAVQDNFEVVLEIWKCMWSTKIVMDWICNRPSNTINSSRIREKFEASGTVHDVHKQRSGSLCTATSPASSAVMLEQFTHSPQRSARQCVCETGISRLSVQHILKCAEWKVYIPRLLHALNEHGPDQRVQFCEWFQH